MHKRQRTIIFNSLSYIILGTGALLMLVPFIWMVSTSLKSLSDVFIYPPKIFGEKIVFDNYLRISDRFPFFIILFNTIKIAIIIVLGQLFTCSMAGFAFTYLNFKGKEFIFLLYLLSIMIPFHVQLVPTFSLLRVFKLLDTHWAIILPLLISPFGTFLMRQFFTSVPKDLGAAAKIDGCNPWGVYWRIYLPLSKPALTTLGHCCPV
jgi:multiple sugar transport system permease protein